MGLLWSPICLSVAVLHFALADCLWWQSVLLVFPPMIMQLFICLSIWYICKANPFSKTNLFKFSLIHLLSVSLITLLWVELIFLNAKALTRITENPDWAHLYQNFKPMFWTVGVALYFMAALIYYLLLEVEKKRTAEKELLQQSLLASQAQLNALKTTIHPHFLFNSLNMIAPLAKTSPEKVRPIINQLSSFLQYSLRYGQQEFVPLKRELEHVQNYLHIESLRLGERLKIHFDIDQTILDKHMVPMTLLPLVENAIKHGISQCMEGGALNISLKRKSERIQVLVENPFENNTSRLQGQGLGLDTLKKRLAVIYGHQARLHIEKSKDLFRVVLSFPMQGDINENRN